MTPRDGLSGMCTEGSEAIVNYYDDWASGYDDDLAAWGYEAPKITAERLAQLAPLDAHVLDAGCGTGLVGAALVATGFSRITGIDASADSLAQAQERGIYAALSRHDLNRLPLDLPRNGFGALVCIGVMTYVPDVEAFCRECCRLLTPGSPIVLTQRSDLFEERGTQAAYDALVSDGTWEIIEVSGPRPYLPRHPEFADRILVHYGVFRRT